MAEDKTTTAETSNFETFLNLAKPQDSVAKPVNLIFMGEVHMDPTDEVYGANIRAQKHAFPDGRMAIFVEQAPQRKRSGDSSSDAITEWQKDVDYYLKHGHAREGSGDISLRG